MIAPIITATMLSGSRVRLQTVSSAPVGATKIQWQKKSSINLDWSNPVEVLLSESNWQIHDFASLTEGEWFFRARFASDTEFGLYSEIQILLILNTTYMGTYQAIIASEPYEIYDGLADHEVKFFVMADKCYIMDGTNYLVYDGTAISQITPYAPTLTLGRAPTGGGTPNEDFNLLGAGFKDSFSGTSGDTAYTLSLSGLDATLVTATVNGVAKVENTDFTVNRTTGVVTFSVSPGVGTNNVVITAYKTIAGKADKIKKCTDFEIFGGTNDTRVFVYGPDNTIYRSGLNDPTYFPENGYTRVGNDTAKVLKMVKQYDTCVIIKEKSPNDSPIWNMTYELDSNGKATFPIKPVNDQKGCKAKGTVQIINNNPTWLSNDGVYSLVSSNVRDERNVQHISSRVDPRLLYESNLENALSVDFDRKYWLTVNGKVYIYDYAIDEWYPWDNVNPSCFMEMDGVLYFGSSQEGMVYKFKKRADDAPYNDNGQAINAYWYSMQTAFGADEYTKLVPSVFFTIKPSYKASADLYYITNKKQSDLVKTKRVDMIDFSNLDFSTFSFMTSSFPQEATAKIKAKKIIYFQVMLQNNKVDENMGILSVGIPYRLLNLVK